MTVRLKKSFLKLIKEDEEFRYAVAGVMGLHDIRDGLIRLEEGQGRLEAAVAKLEEAVAHLIDAQTRLEQRQVSLEDSIAKLIDSQRRLEERQSTLEGSMIGLGERQDRLEDAVARLAEAQSRTEVVLQELAKHVGRLSDTVGFGLEDIARVVVPGWLYRHEGISVGSLERRFIQADGEMVEINLYGEGARDGEKIIVIGEAKARIYRREVEDFIKVVEKAKAIIDATLYKFMFGYLIHPSAEEEARKNGITLIASYMR